MRESAGPEHAPNPEHNDDQAKTLGGWLAVGFATLTTALGTFGIASGDIERIIRNEPEQAVVWIAFMGLGVVSGIVVSKTGTGGSSGLQGPSLLLATVGVVVIAATAVWSITFGDEADLDAVLQGQPWRLPLIRFLFWLLIGLAIGWLLSRAVRQVKDEKERRRRLWFSWAFFALASLAVHLSLEVLVLQALIAGAGLLLSRLRGSNEWNVLSWARKAAGYLLFERRYRGLRQDDGRVSPLVLMNVLASVSLFSTLLAGKWPPSVFSISSVTALSSGVALLGPARFESRLLLRSTLRSSGPVVVLLSLLVFLLAAILAPTWVGLAVVVGIWAVVLGLLIRNTHSGGVVTLKWTTGLLTVGVIAYLVGVAGFFALGVENSSTSDRPRVVAELSEDPVGAAVVATIQAGGLSFDQHVVVAIEGLNSTFELSDVVAGLGDRKRDLELSSAQSAESFDFVQIIHLSRVGADENGEVDTQITVPVSTGLYERIRVSAFLARPDAQNSLGRLESIQSQIRAERTRQAGAEETILDELNQRDWDLANILLAASRNADTAGADLIEAAQVESGTVQATTSSRSAFENVRDAILPERLESQFHQGPPEATSTTEKPTWADAVLTSVAEARSAGVHDLVSAIEQGLAQSETGSCDENDAQQGAAGQVQTEDASELNLLCSLAERVSFATHAAGYTDTYNTSLETLISGATADRSLRCELVEARGHVVDLDRAINDIQPLVISEESNLASVADRGRSVVVVLRTEIYTLSNLLDEAGLLAEAGRVSCDDPETHSSSTTSTTTDSATTTSETSGGFSSRSAKSLIVEEIADRSTLINLEKTRLATEAEFVAQRRAAVHCNEGDQASGCVILLMPELQARPELHATFEEDAGVQELSIVVGANDMAATDYIRVETYGFPPEHEGELLSDQLLFSSVVGPDVAGLVDRTFILPYAGENEQVCVVATLVRRSIAHTAEQAQDPSNGYACHMDSPHIAHVLLKVPPSG